MTREEEFGAFMRSTRERKQVPRERLAEMIGYNDRTLARWECGEGLRIIFAVRDYMDALGISARESSMSYREPEIYTGIASRNVDEKRAALVDYISNAAPDAEIEGLIFEIFCEHGSSWPAMLQMHIADAQCPLIERIGVASLIAANYSLAKEHGRIVFPDQPQPDIELLLQAIEYAREAVSKNLHGYTNLLVNGKGV